ncbi:LysR family transcriptional regulator [Parasporobacterium paucivorans]|uniref:DNA-binding transcriptional regulator, LysR family n=1 Tax=Parasporobacterium paucivorans DSM 15970 TaxID=1122934 RepID=A0A1M6CU48_9FIRM|nr:LysR family transcriptional regulator [Parasporobacterium paucivorans]SHI64480.1 DNA-binding transcriptional regulator, LysR family [Parasporobacterium paucivorans DSM 15970]
MTTHQIKYFISAAKHLSFTKCAQEHYTSQPNISRQISLLEKELGFNLFNHNKKNLQLTPSGAIMLTHLIESIENIEKGVATAVNASQGKTGNLIIGCLDPFNMELFVPDYIVPFQQKFPGISLSLITGSFQELRQGLKDGKMDVIFTLDFEMKNIQNVISHKISDVLPLILMSTSHPLAAKSDLRMEDFRDETFIVPSVTDSPGRLEDVNRFLSNFGFSCSKVIYSPNIASQLIYVRSGLGVALVDTGITRMELSYYKYFLPAPQPETITAIAAWRNDNLNPGVNLFTQQFSQK